VKLNIKGWLNIATGVKVDSPVVVVGTVFCECDHFHFLQVIGLSPTAASLAEGRRGRGDRIWPVLPLNTAVLHAQTQLLCCNNIPLSLTASVTSRLINILGDWSIRSVFFPPCLLLTPPRSMVSIYRLDGAYIPLSPYLVVIETKSAPIHALLLFNGFSRFTLDLISHMNNVHKGCADNCCRSVKTR